MGKYIFAQQQKKNSRPTNKKRQIIYMPHFWADKRNWVGLENVADCDWYSKSIFKVKCH